MKRKVYILSLVVTVIGLMLLFNQKNIGYLISTNFYGNREHYVNCNKLPSISEASKILIDHKKEAIEIVSIGSDTVSINGSNLNVIEANKNPQDVYTGSNVSFRLSEVNEGDCRNKAQLEMTAGGTKDYEKIRQIIGDTFFGIPYRITNI